ncbi:MAG TPA: hypothetical protein VL198_20875 [Pseudolabrys sp.]|jgi:hypothetical protein|nr:hypothetical protein [Pseudolabrys sp.]
MSHTQAGAASKLRNRSIGPRDADVAQCLQFQFYDWVFAKPIRRRQRRERAKSANARASVVGNWQQQQFQFSFCPLRGPSSHPGDSTNRLIESRAANVRNLRAACFVPKRVEGLSFNFATKKGAHAGAGKSEPNSVNEVGTEHECIAERVTDSGRINF